MSEWNLRMMSLAKFVSCWSKDPSTKVGAVISDKDNRIISVGYNGFAKGVEDTKDRLNNRDIKYSMVIHAEDNAILFAKRDLTDCRLFVYPLFTCSRCAAKIIQSGIKYVYYPEGADTNERRWVSEYDLAKEQYDDAEIVYKPINLGVKEEKLNALVLSAYQN